MEGFNEKGIHITIVCSFANPRWLLVQTSAVCSIDTNGFIVYAKYEQDILRRIEM